MGATLRWVPLLGSSVRQHELFHAVQEQQPGGVLFAAEADGSLRWYQCIWIEIQAHLFGGPFIGVPVLATIFGGLGTIVVLVLLFLYFGVRSFY